MPAKCKLVAPQNTTPDVKQTKTSHAGPSSSHEREAEIAMRSPSTLFIIYNAPNHRRKNTNTIHFK